MKPKIILTMLLIIACGSIYSQSGNIYLGPSMQQLYNGDTRSLDGSPGHSYWTNTANYKLQAEILPDSSTLVGKGEVIYYNNSPDTLNTLIVQLLPDLYRKGNKRSFTIGPWDITDGMEIDSLFIDNSIMPASVLRRRSATNLYLALPKPLIPGCNVELKFRWSFHIPERVPIRMGKYGENVFFIAYWYPKIAVYDDVSGWDRIDYDGSLEFYSDNCNFDYEITVPDDYLVWATGDLNNDKDVLPETIYKRFQNSKKSDEIINIVTDEDYETGIIKSLGGTKTWKFTAKNIPDVSFGCAANYLWDGSSVVVDKKTKRRVFTDAAYPPGAVYWDQAAYITQKSVEYLSLEMPGYPFPYSHMTSFCNGKSFGGGGMETPMMANNGVPEVYGNYVNLLFHEISHTFFPFFVGTNEKKYAWMDEGWATFLPFEFVSRYDTSFSNYEFSYNYFLCRLIETEYNLPIMSPSVTLKGVTYSYISYGKTFLAYTALIDLLGFDTFRDAMKEYISRWNGKHPLPYDFFFTFEEVSGKDLTWFWNSWFYGTGTCDLALVIEKGDNNNNEIFVELIGELPVSANVRLIFKNGTEKIIRNNPEVWKDGVRKIKLKTGDINLLSKAEIITDNIPDTNPSNNSIIPN